MALRKCHTGLALASIFAIGIFLLGSVPQATAETLNFKTFNHTTKMEAVPMKPHFQTLRELSSLITFYDLLPSSKWYTRAVWW